MNAAIEAAARAQCEAGGFDPSEMMSNDGPRWLYYVDGATAAIIAFLRNCEVSEAVWDGLPRQLIMWMDMDPKTPRALFKHLERSGCEVPQWLRDEPEMQSLDHVPSKGTRAVIVFKAMAAQAATELEGK